MHLFRFLLPGLFVMTTVQAQPGAPPAIDRITVSPDTAAADSVALPATNVFAIDTPLGRMVVRLYDDTPLHRDNFKRLAARGFYDGTTFHRIIDGFMIQGGDSLSKDDDMYNDGMGDPGYTVPAEIVPTRFHKRGALAAARNGDDVNPERRSSGSQFYLVDGQLFNDVALEQVAQRVRQMTGKPDFTFSPEAREAYTTVGGAPHLDQSYTVFGELVEGFEVLDLLAASQTARKAGQDVHPAVIDRPFALIPMIVTPVEVGDGE